MAKHLKGDWFIVLRYNFVSLLKSFIANVLKWKAHLKAKFKCLCATMCFLMMSLLSSDCIKMEID